MNGEITSRQAALLRTPKAVSLGTYHRVLDQAVENLEESICTVLVGVSVGLLHEEDLVRLVSLLPRTGNLDIKSESEFLAVIQAIVTRIVTK